MLFVLSYLAFKKSLGPSAHLVDKEIKNSANKEFDKGSKENK